MVFFFCYSAPLAQGTVNGASRLPSPQTNPTAINQTTETPGQDRVVSTLAPTSTPIKISITTALENEVSFSLPGNFDNQTIDTQKRWMAFEIYTKIENCGGGGICGEHNIAVCDLKSKHLDTPCFTIFPVGHKWYSPYLSFSPDGKYFAVSTIDATWIFETTYWKQIIEIHQEKIRSDIIWFPDSQGITVQFLKDDNVLYFLNVNGESKPLLSMSEVFPEGLPPEFPGVSAWGPAFSPEGDRIAYIRSFLDHDELWEKNLESGNSTLIYKDNDAIGVEPKWSPNGRYISVYCGALCLYDLREHTYLKILENPNNTLSSFLDYSYAWSPLGNQIAVQLTYEDLDEGMYIVDVETKAGSFVKHGHYWINQWLPDGSIIIRTIDSFGWIIVNSESHIP